jgi:hypothetical protein
LNNSHIVFTNQQITAQTTDNTMTDFPFLNGACNKFAVMSIDNLNDNLVDGALKYISKHGYHLTVSNTEKHIIVPTNVSIPKNEKTFTIEFESLFTDALGTGSDDVKQRDYTRFQTHPDAAKELLKCREIKSIVDCVQATINQQVNGYVPAKVSFLYSLPYGKEQGLHQDDPRSDSIVASDGSLLSALIALQDGTKLDVRNGSFVRKTYTIPVGTMFVFDGKLVHGGATYPKHNLRLHIYFRRKPDKTSEEKSDIDDNIIAHTYRCPVENCPRSIQKTNFTIVQMRNHWRLHHSKKEKMGWKRYEAKQSGNLHMCQKCGESFLNKDGLTKHMLAKHKPGRKSKRKRGSESK